ncbi:DUF6069 family protein [Rhodococcus sp. Q]|uniref:DUF6069 family protein n=1 Tax=Rhodococcus sp. Q TaxID=2502252 RepID=UPI0010F7EBFF|nr:DUF6069 family protein [Rhodococcus sp. Q]
MTANRPGPSTTTVDAKRLWAGGAATALVAALAALVGLLLVRDVLDVPVITPATGIGDSQAANLAGHAVVAALIATALLHVLLLTTPRATSFFGWIGVLATIAVALLPFAAAGTAASRLCSAAIYFVVGIAIVTLLSGVARSARTN